MTDRLAMENIQETAMVDIAYDMLKNKSEPIMYQDIMSEIATLKGFTEDDVEKYIAQLYTAINIDGRFTCVGRGLWGLKDWYPIDQTTESAVAGNIKDDYSDEDIEDPLYDDEPDLYRDRDEDVGAEVDDLEDDLEDAVVEDDEDALLEEVEEVEGLEEALEVEGEDLDDEDDEDFDDEEELEDEEEV